MRLHQIQPVGIAFSAKQIVRSVSIPIDDSLRAGWKFEFFRRTGYPVEFWVLLQSVQDRAGAVAACG